MKLIIKGIELSKQEIKALDTASDIMEQYASELEFCGADYEVIEIINQANETILSISGGTFYDEYIEEE